MDTIEILEVSVDGTGRLRVVPASNPDKTFRFVYRAAMEIEWDEELQDFYTPIPKDWSYSDWFRQILTAVRSELGVHLRVVPSTAWKNVPTAQCDEMEKDSGQ